MQNQISKNWQELKFGDIATLHRGYDLPKEKMTYGKYPVVFSNGAINYHNQFKIKGPGVITGRSGSLGNTFYIEDDYWPHNTTLYISDFHGNNPKFVFYLLKTLNLSFLNAGSGVPTLNRNHVHEIQLRIPTDPKVQKRIALILSSFDDKIESNNKIAKTLEEMAQILFKEWFVNFRFPGYEKVEFVDSELGKIPKGWAVGVLDNYIGELESGKRPKGGASTYTKGIPSIGAENIDGLDNSNFSNIKLIPEDFFDSMNMGKIKDYDILIYKDGGVPGIFKVKFTLIGQGYPFLKAAINEHVFRLQANKQERQYFLYFYLSLRKSVKYFESVGGKAAVPGINSSDFKNLPLLIPSENLVQSFHKLVCPTIKKILNTRLQNQKLVALRDLLLPKLMKGEMKI